MDIFFPYFDLTKSAPSQTVILLEKFEQAIKNGDSASLEQLFKKEHGSFAINQTFEWKNTKNLNAFQVICLKIHENINMLEFDTLLLGNIECCRILLENGINVQYRDPVYKSEAIDYALLTGIREIIEMSLEAYKKLKISIVHKDLLSTILNFYYDYPARRSQYLDILELLINEGLDVNMFDYEWAKPPIYLAAKFKFQKVVELFCRKKVYEIDFDFFHDNRGRTARYLIHKYNLYQAILPKSNALTDYEIYEAIFRHDTTQFITEYKSCKKELTPEKKISILFRILNSGNEEIFEYFLNDINDIFMDREVLLGIACNRGFYKIVQILLKHYGELQYDMEFLKKIINCGFHFHNIKGQEQWVNHRNCLKTLIYYSALNLNKVGWREETILEVAINTKQYGMVLTLLNAGASLLKYNVVGTDTECCLRDIEPKILEEHFNNSILVMNAYNISPKRKRLIMKDVSKIDYYVDFISILPPRQRPVKPEYNNKSIEHSFAEMKVLEEISLNSEYKYLLTHPFVSLFISLKWRRVRMLYYSHVFVYVAFIVILNLFIMWETLLLYVILTILFVMLGFWNALNILVFKTKYFSDGENFMKVVVALCSTGILAIYFLEKTRPLMFIKRQIYGLTALFSITNVFFLAQYLSGFSVYVIMIKSIYKIMFTAFLQYSFFFIGFGTSFFILFHNIYDRFFGDYVMSILKTILMTTKSYDSDFLGLQNNFPNIRHLIMLLFVLLVCLGLLNLLIGLAVNDINDIKSNAELYSEIFKIKIISIVETIFLRPDVPKWLKFSRRICLFPIWEERTSIEIYKKTSAVYFTASNIDIPLIIDEKCMEMIEQATSAKSFQARFE